jgi:hypothetical protein
VKLFDIDDKTLAIGSSSRGNVEAPTPQQQSSEVHAPAEETAPAEREIPELLPGRELPEDVLAQAERLVAEELAKRGKAATD